jgi:hypothetical protein
MNESANPRRRSIDIDADYLRHRLPLRGQFMRHRWDPAYPMGRPANRTYDTTVRASDAERNEVADKLSRHFAEGRLDQAEFKTRLDTAMSATTRGDLVGLFDDLPRLATESPPPPPRRRRLIPFVLIVVFVAIAAGSTFSVFPYLHVPWLLIAVVGFFLWHRMGRRHHHTHHIPPSTSVLDA